MDLFAGRAGHCKVTVLTQLDIAVEPVVHESPLVRAKKRYSFRNAVLLLHLAGSEESTRDETSPCAERYQNEARQHVLTAGSIAAPITLTPVAGCRP
jgi:hypothetical protein